MVRGALLQISLDALVSVVSEARRSGERVGEARMRAANEVQKTRIMVLEFGSQRVGALAIRPVYFACV